MAYPGFGKQAPKQGVLGPIEHQIFGIIAGLAGKAIIGAIKKRKQKSDQQNQQTRDEQKDLLNRKNDFNQFLATQQASDPSKQLKGFKSSLLAAGKLRGAKGTSISGEIGRKQVEGSLAQDPALEQLAASFADPGSNNLGTNKESGLLEFIAPQFKQAVSREFAASKSQGNFIEDGIEKAFGTKEQEARRGKRKGEGFMSFLRDMIPGAIEGLQGEAGKSLMDSLGNRGSKNAGGFVGG